MNKLGVMDRRFFGEILLYQPTLAYFQAPTKPPGGIQPQNSIGEELADWETVVGLENVHCTFAPAGTFRDKERRGQEYTTATRVRLVLLDGVYGNIKPPMRMILKKPGHIGDPIEYAWKVVSVETDAVGLITRLGAEEIRVAKP